MEKEEKEESLSFLDSRAIVISVAPLYHCWAAALQHRTWETRRRRRRNQRATPIYWELHEEKRSLSIDPAQPILRSTADSRDLLPFGEEEEMHQKKKKKKTSLEISLSIRVWLPGQSALSSKEEKQKHNGCLSLSKSWGHQKSIGLIHFSARIVFISFFWISNELHSLRRLIKFCVCRRNE